MARAKKRTEKEKEAETYRAVVEGLIKVIDDAGVDYVRAYGLLHVATMHVESRMYAQASAQAARESTMTGHETTKSAVPSYIG